MSTETTPPAVPDEAVAAALKAVPGYQRQAREAMWIYPSTGQVRAMLEAAAPLIVAKEPLQTELDAARASLDRVTTLAQAWIAPGGKSTLFWPDMGVRVLEAVKGAEVTAEEMRLGAKIGSDEEGETP